MRVNTEMIYDITWGITEIAVGVSLLALAVWGIIAALSGISKKIREFGKK